MFIGLGSLSRSLSTIPRLAYTGARDQIRVYVLIEYFWQINRVSEMINKLLIIGNRFLSKSSVHYARQIVEKLLKYFIWIHKRLFWKIWTFNFNKTYLKGTFRVFYITKYCVLCISILYFLKKIWNLTRCNKINLVKFQTQTEQLSSISWTQTWTIYKLI